MYSKERETKCYMHLNPFDLQSVWVKVPKHANINVHDVQSTFFSWYDNQMNEMNRWMSYEWVTNELNKTWISCKTHEWVLKHMNESKKTNMT